MTMIEVSAERKGRVLHNSGAFRAHVSSGQLAERWMVEAKSGYSAEFWS
jgi:hypothetical protein